MSRFEPIESRYERSPIPPLWKRTDRQAQSRLPTIAANDYDLSLNRYKEVAYEAVEYDSPKVILKRLAKLEEEIEKGRKELEGTLK